MRIAAHLKNEDTALYSKNILKQGAVSTKRPVMW